MGSHPHGARPLSGEAGHRCDWVRIAFLERELYGETFHHIGEPACHCDECMARRDEQIRQMHEAIHSDWVPEHEHHDPVWILPPPRHDVPQL